MYVDKCLDRCHAAGLVCEQQQLSYQHQNPRGASAALLTSFAFWSVDLLQGPRPRRFRGYERRTAAMTITDTTTAAPSTAWPAERLELTLKLQRAADRTEGYPSARLRRDRLDRLLAAMLSSTDELTAAVSLDFGNRPAGLTQVAELAVCAHEIARFRRNVARWMKRRQPQPKYLRLSGIRAWIEPTPLGVVGIYAPWNFPIALAIQPVAAAIAAGNRVMLKMSEATPRTAEVMRKTIAAHFAQE